MPDLSAASLLLTGESTASTSTLETVFATLRVGAVDLSSKEQTLLRSLVRLLDGRAGLRLHYSEELASCDVAFVPEAWPHRVPGRCVSVQLRDDAAPTSSGGGAGLSIAPPLRATNVMMVLHAAAALMADRASAPSRGPTALFLALTRLIAARERRTTLLPLLDGAELCVDFTNGLLHGPLSLDELLTDSYRLGEPRRPGMAEADALRQQPSLRLRSLVWTLAHRLGEASVPATELRGSYRLQRWPDAVALSRPGYPRLAALLTNRSMSAAQASASSGLSLDAVRWFLAASLALGIALPDETDPPPSAVRAPAPNPVQRSLLGRLRERLKLW